MSDILSPIYNQYEDEIRYMNLDQLRDELYEMEHPTTDNRITQMVMANKAAMLRQRIAQLTDYPS